MANKAAWMTAPQVIPFKIDDAPMPVPKAHEVIVRNRAVAFNPVDWVMQAKGLNVPTYPFIEGCDTAGEITAVGSAVKDFKDGDRVIAILDPVKTSNTANAAFQLFSLAGSNSIAKIPDHISFAEASVLPLAISTAASALFQTDTLALPPPQLDPVPTGKVVLVWGGSSSIGACAIQLVVAAGFDVATTASSHNLEHCKALGAKYVFDYNKESVATDITTALRGMDFGGAFCAIIDSNVIKQCARIVTVLEGKKFVSTVLASIIPLQEGLPDDVKTSNGKSINP